MGISRANHDHMSALPSGIYSGLQAFLDAAAFASIVFGPASLPLDVGIQHALVGFVLMQLTVTWLGASRVLLVPVSYEVIPFLARFAAAVTHAINLLPGSKPEAALATVLAGSVLVSLIAALSFAIVAALASRSDGVEVAIGKLLPHPLQAGIFATIGWGLFELAFESLGMSGPIELAQQGKLLTEATTRLWMPAVMLGGVLCVASRYTSHPALFPGFVTAVVLGTHAVRLASGASVTEARTGGWLMAELSGRPCTELWRALSPWNVRFDVLVRPEVAKELLSAALFGPVVNSLLNLILVPPLITPYLDRPFSLASELATHAAGSLALALGGGYSNYIAISNTAVHLKCGGTSRLSCVVAAAVAALFLLVHPLFGLVGLVPTLVVAAICAFIGFDFVYDNLVAPILLADFKTAAIAWLFFGCCRQIGMLPAVLLALPISLLARLMTVTDAAKKKD